MRIKIPFIFLLSILFEISKSYDTDLWGYVISGSHTFENFRHSINSLAMYNFLKKNGLPDEKIITGLSEFHACTPYSAYPGKLLMTDPSQNIIASCHSDVNIDYKDRDFHNFQIIDILRGRSGQLINNFRKLKSDKNSRIIIIITTHGGENFIKVRGKSVILSDELNRTLNEMWIKERYKEILFILDTCEGITLFDYVDVPNIYFVASSVKDQKAQSHSFDNNQMTPTSDKFHFKLLEYLERTYKKKNFNYNIHEMFQTIQRNEREFISSDVTILNKIKREIMFEEFFGNYLKKQNQNVKYNFQLSYSNETKKSSIMNTNSKLKEIRTQIDDEVLNIRKYHDQHYSLKNNNHLNNRTEFESQLPINTFFFFMLLYLFYNLINN